MRVFRALCEPSGTLIVILQAASSTLGEVSPSPYKSLQLLAPVMSLQDQITVQECASAAGFSLMSSRKVALPSGKSFAVVSFRG